MNKELLYGIIGLVIGVFLTVFVASNAVNNNMSGIMQMMRIRPQTNLTDNRNLITTNIDRNFIEQMIPHHEDAITMADIALQKAKHPEIKQLAKDIKRTQSEEITKMKGWYTNWYGKDVPQAEQAMGGHGMGMMGDESDITKLETTGNFDKAFIEEMIPHHQMAVMMATMLKNGTNRPEMEKLADNIISAQSKEINQMRQWYKDWEF